MAEAKEHLPLHIDTLLLGGRGLRVLLRLRAMLELCHQKIYQARQVSTEEPD